MFKSRFTNVAIPVFTGALALVSLSGCVDPNNPNSQYYPYPSGPSYGGPNSGGYYTNSYDRQRDYERQREYEREQAEQRELRHERHELNKQQWEIDHERQPPPGRYIPPPPPAPRAEHCP